MGYGQYSAQAIARKSKKGMLAEIASEIQASGKPCEVITSRIVARNTIEYRLSDETLRVRLHSTDIFTRDPRGNVTLDSGGFYSMLTRGRMNEALTEHRPGYRVESVRGFRLITPAGKHRFNQRVTIGRTGAIVSDRTTQPRKAASGKEKLPVLFRVECAGKFKGDVSAVFPTLSANPGMAVCYAHIGQHSECSRSWFNETRNATPDECAALLAELTDIYSDCDLVVKQRWARS
jgi:hypothetical protein